MFITSTSSKHSRDGKVCVFTTNACLKHFRDTISAEMITDVNIKSIPKQKIRIKLRILRVKINSINQHQITEVTDITDFHMVAVHISKHSLFRLKSKHSLFS